MMHNFEMANATRYGLAGAVHTARIGLALRAAQRMQAGTVWVNSYGPTPELNAPSGDFRQGGHDKDLGLTGLMKYYRSKHLWLAAAA
jgi:acyl-CoA reductase-like NAD-dependent aldehyde dehydrogenase